MNPDDANAPVAEEAQEQPVQEQPVEQTEAPEPQEQGQEAQPAEESSDEAAEPSQVTQEQPAEAEEVDWSQYVPQLNAPVPTDENGQVDPVQWENQIMQKLAFRQDEVRAWTQLEQKYPEIRTDAELRDMIVANRLYEVQKGGSGKLEASAKRVFDRLGLAENKGAAKKATNITVQKSAALEKPSGPRNTAPSDARDRIRQGDTQAIHSQLTAWLNDGKI